MSKSLRERRGSRVTAEPTLEELARARELRKLHDEAMQERARARQEQTRTHKGKTQSPLPRQPDADRLDQPKRDIKQRRSESSKLKTQPEASNADQRSELTSGLKQDAKGKSSAQRANSQTKAKAPPVMCPTGEAQGTDTKNQSPSRLRLSSYLFFADREILRCTTSGLAWYEALIDDLVDWLEAQGIARPEEVVPRHMQAYLGHCEVGDLPTRVGRDRANAARIFFRLLVNEELINRSPMESLPNDQKPPSVLSRLSPDKFKRVLAAARSGRHPQRDTAMLLALLDLGCRASELVKLDVGDVDLGTGAVLIRHDEGEKDRVGLLYGEACSAIQEYLTQRGDASATESLWLSDYGERLTVRHVAHLLQCFGVPIGKYKPQGSLWP
jgi:site-specific recombinase XerD